MRRTFADILKYNKVDIKREYKRLYDLFFKATNLEYSVFEAINIGFNEIWFCGTCNSLYDFNEEYGFNFEEQPQNFDFDYLITFCEYVYNLVYAINPNGKIYFRVPEKVERLKEQIGMVIERIGYTNIHRKDGFTIFVPKSPQAILVAECVSEKLSYKVLEYNHYSLKGNLEGKKSILIKIAEELEPQRKDLKGIDSKLESNIFYAFNYFNIRHNNCNPKDKAKYISQFANLKNEQVEQLYDWTYNQCLIAFIKLENENNSKIFSELKNKIDNKIF